MRKTSKRRVILFHNKLIIGKESEHQPSITMCTYKEYGTSLETT
jgi:hypothetical protein